MLSDSSGVYRETGKSCTGVALWPPLLSRSDYAAGGAATEDRPYRAFHYLGSRPQEGIYFLKRGQRRSRSDGAALQTRDCVCESQCLFNRETGEQPQEAAERITRTRSVPALTVRVSRYFLVIRDLHVRAYRATTNRSCPLFNAMQVGFWSFAEGNWLRDRNQSTAKAA
jgi:hypothetical protein